MTPQEHFERHFDDSSNDFERRNLILTDCGQVFRIWFEGIPRGPGEGRSGKEREGPGELRRARVARGL